MGYLRALSCIYRGRDDLLFDKGEVMKQTLTLFQRFLLLVIIRILVIAGIPAKLREDLSSLLYRVSVKGELTENDLGELE